MFADRESYEIVGRDYSEVKRIQEQLSDSETLLKDFGIGTGFIYNDLKKERSFGIRFFNYQPLTRRSLFNLTISTIGRLPAEVGTFVEFMGVVNAAGESKTMTKPQVLIIKQPNFGKAA